ncbi:MAG: hypothetical protein JWM18_1027 [Chloroflexi bacterium]|jgi:hypothetical protein|nr:hypothetical protein [Chloroflexota bacterium]
MRFIRTLQSLGCAAVLAAGTVTLIVPTTAHADVACNEQALVDAINAANAMGGGTVTLANPCTYVLTSGHGGGGNDGLPLITTPITLLGGANSTITRSQTAAPFRIAEVTGTGALTLTSVTLSDGYAVGLLGLAGGDGGGIYNNGAVTLTNSTLSGNHAGAKGGGIYNGLGATTFTSSTVSDNSTGSLLSAGDGGGIYNSGGTVTFTSGNLIRNQAVGAVLGLVGGTGGGMYDNGGTVTFTSSFVQTNTASRTAGGILRSGGIMTITTTAITGNTPNNCLGSSPAVPDCTH